MSPQVISSPDRDLPPLFTDALVYCKPDLFPLGRTVHTAAIEYWAQENLPDGLLDNDLWLAILIKAHVTGCWDELPENDRQLNLSSLEPGNEGRIFSAYTILDEKIFVITEWDRSVTTVLLASDY